MADRPTTGSARTWRLVVSLSLVALIAPATSTAKELRTTVCGSDGCRVTASPLAGVSTTGRAAAPRSGRFFTLRLEFPRATAGFALVYERRRHLVRAKDAAARAFLGTGWHVLERSLRPHYDAAVRGVPARTRP